VHRPRRWIGLRPGCFLPTIEREFVSLLYSPEHRPQPQLMFALLGEQAGAIGAALLPVVHH